MEEVSTMPLGVIAGQLSCSMSDRLGATASAEQPDGNRGFDGVAMKLRHEYRRGVRWSARKPLKNGGDWRSDGASITATMKPWAAYCWRVRMTKLPSPQASFTLWLNLQPAMPLPQTK